MESFSEKEVNKTSKRVGLKTIASFAFEVDGKIYLQIGSLFRAICLLSHFLLLFLAKLCMYRQEDQLSNGKLHN